MKNYGASNENYTLFLILSFTWGLLWTIIGALIYLGFRVFARKRITAVGYKQGRKALKVKGSFGAISLGLFIVLDEYLYDDLEVVNHELGHTIQNAWFGPLFIPLIAIPSGIRALFWDKIQDRYYKKHGKYKDYYGIWFEKQATVLGNRYFDVVE